MIGGLGVPELSIVMGYFIPSAVALIRKHPQKMAVLMLNIFLGWTLLGWVAAMIWAVWSYKVKKDVTTVEDV